MGLLCASNLDASPVACMHLKGFTLLMFVREYSFYVLQQAYIHPLRRSWCFARNKRGPKVRYAHIFHVRDIVHAKQDRIILTRRGLVVAGTNERKDGQYDKGATSRDTVVR
jgi:hypothetical protein